MSKDKKEGLFNKLKKNLKGANPAGLVREKVAQYVSESKANKNTEKLAKELMGKAPEDKDKPYSRARFPEPQLIGDNKWEKRKKEIKEMIKKGKMNQAKDFIKEKREEFDRLNY